MKAPSASKLIISLLVPLAVGGVSGFITAHEIGTWFAGLQKPSFNPPNWLFGPVWTVLYVLMGISCYLIWKLPSTVERRRALWVYGLQLFFNFWWSIIFFSFHLIGFALVDIAIMWVLIMVMIAQFRKLQPLAGNLQVPYLGWVTFATALNIGILMLN